MSSPGVDGKLLEFFENFRRGLLRENFFAGKFGGRTVGVFGFADFDSDESFLAAAPQQLVAGPGVASAEHILRNGRVKVDLELGLCRAGAEHAERENRVRRFCNLQANHILVGELVGVSARSREPVGECLEETLGDEA